jgi:hypothetical protein
MIREHAGRPPDRAGAATNDPASERVSRTAGAGNHGSHAAEPQRGGHTRSADPRPAVLSDPAAEWALLGALATSGQRGDLARIAGDDFTSEPRRVLFEAIARRLEAGEPIDFALLAADVRGAGVWAADIFELFDNPGVSVPVYLPLVRACRLRRMLHSLGACLTAHALDAAHDPRDVARWCRRQLDRIEVTLGPGGRS